MALSDENMWFPNGVLMAYLGGVQCEIARGVGAWAPLTLKLFYTVQNTSSV